MFIERTSKEIIFLLPAGVDVDDLQEFLDYARFKELTKVFKDATDSGRQPCG